MEKSSKAVKAKGDTATHSKSQRRNYKRELEQTILEMNSLKDQLLRKAAEFENYKKRTSRDFAEHLKNANAQLITDLLPIMDDFDRLFATDFSTMDKESLWKGSELIRQKFIDILKSHGLKTIDALDKEFDPEKHDALLLKEVENKDPNIVVEEYSKGYEINDRVLRHSKVIVSK